MSTTLLSSGTLLVDDGVRAEAQEFVDTAHDRTVAGLSIVLDDGTVVELPEHLAGFVGHVLHGLTRGPLSVGAIPAELTSTTAADILAVSRPTLMKWVGEGVLKSHKVGSHHRFDTGEVMALAKARRAMREQAFADLRALEDALEESDSQ